MAISDSKLQPAPNKSFLSMAPTHTYSKTTEKSTKLTRGEKKNSGFVPGSDWDRQKISIEIDNTFGIFIDSRNQRDCKSRRGYCKYPCLPYTVNFHSIGQNGNDKHVPVILLEFDAKPHDQKRSNKISNLPQIIPPDVISSPQSFCIFTLSAALWCHGQ